MSAIHEEQPTFDTYWRKNKEHTATNSLVFVIQSDPGQPNTKGMPRIEMSSRHSVRFEPWPTHSKPLPLRLLFPPSTTYKPWLLLIKFQSASEKPEESEQSAKDKRRAQVRRAQNQHRARKANYTKQLEADIVSIREKIEDVERDRCILETENQAIRAQLCEQQQQQQQVALDYGKHAENTNIDTTSTAYSQEDTMSYGCSTDGVDLDFFDVVDASLNGVLGEVYYEDGSSAVSSGIYSSPLYDSGSNTPFVPLPDMTSLGQSGQMLDYMSRFPY